MTDEPAARPLLPSSVRGRVGAAAAGLVLLLALLTALDMVRPTGNLVLWVFALLVYTFPLHVLVLAAIVLGLGLATWRRTTSRVGLLPLATAAVLAVSAVVPTVAQWSDARAHGASLSIGEYVRAGRGSGEPTSAATLTTLDGGKVALFRWDAEGAVDTAPARPAVVLVHGGAFTAGEPGGLPAWNRLLPDLGAVVFDVGYRLPRDLRGSFRAEVEVGDVKCAVGWIAQNAAELGVDPARIHLFGHSAGASLALLAASTTGDAALPPTCAVADAPVRSVTSFYGPTDLADAWLHSRARGESRDALRKYLGAPLEGAEARYALFSPITHVAPDGPPVLLVMGQEDRLVPVGQVRAYERALRAAGVDVEARYLPGADHTFDAVWGSFPTQSARRAVVDFLTRHL